MSLEITAVKYQEKSRDMASQIVINPKMILATIAN